MHVEECCQALLYYILPEIDRDRRGFCVDVGVGTFAPYYEIFARVGFKTVAVEPLPLAAITDNCHSLGIDLIKSCIYDNDGTLPMYTGTFNGAQNLNLSSIRSDWWGSSPNTVQVRSMTLATLFKTINARTITCLKLDVEGVESVIIQQLQHIQASLLPAIVVFEYGGGGIKQNGKAGWSEAQINETHSCFHILKALHYRTTILIDSMPDCKERVIDLAEVDVLPDILFHPRSIYGNVICFFDCVPDTRWIEKICYPYRKNDIKPPEPLPSIGRLARLMWYLRGSVGRFYK